MVWKEPRGDNVEGAEDDGRSRGRAGGQGKRNMCVGY